MTAITPDIVREHGLNDDEYARIKTLMGREPNFVELGIFSVMWSEHCSYKSTRAHLRRLPTKGPHVIQGPGVFITTIRRSRVKGSLRMMMVALAAGECPAKMHADASTVRMAQFIANPLFWRAKAHSVRLNGG